MQQIFKKRQIHEEYNTKNTVRTVRSLAETAKEDSTNDNCAETECSGGKRTKQTAFPRVRRLRTAVSNKCLREEMK